eukprot:CAMPEP_0175163088 /NCGR_PEP_ID=MMETSP0087-20121206/25530_1 /TAXON_ID=136419 /ORGANISM="Unknown Unknown, Strain D1" /LENGTH=684 /DNA_ID=CAMNT_0016451703 /DNA_START=33 /DNA_END=2084 /DNA_ORIENTATION=-
MQGLDVLDTIVFCDNDEENPATVFCEDCDQNLCAECDDVFHRSKFRACHVRRPVDNPDIAAMTADLADNFDDGEVDEGDYDEGDVSTDESESESAGPRFHIGTPEEENDVTPKSTTKLFGSSLADIMNAQEETHPNLDVPKIVPTLIKALVDLGGLVEEGIFRLSVDKTSLNNLKEQFELGNYNIPTINPHVPACLLKDWLVNLPEAIIPEDMYSAAISCVADIVKTKSQAASNAVKTRIVGIFADMEHTRQRIATYLAALAQQIVLPEYSKHSLMTYENLAVVLGPSFLRNPSTDYKNVVANLPAEQEFVKQLLQTLPTVNLKHLFATEQFDYTQFLTSQTNSSTPSSVNPTTSSTTASEPSQEKTNKLHDAGFISPTPKTKTKSFRLAQQTPTALTPNKNVGNATDSNPQNTSARKLKPKAATRRGSLPSFSLTTNGPSFSDSRVDLQGRQVLKILVVGNASCGKTSVIRRYVTDNFETEYVTTVGADYKTKSVTWGDGTDVHLQLWDIAGQDRYAQMTRPYFQGAHGALVVCDVTRSQSIECVQNWKDDIDKNLQNIPVVLVANKCDLLKDGAEGMKIGGQLQDISTHMNFVSWHIISAKLDDNVTEAMHTLIKSILSQRQKEAKKRRQTIENCSRNNENRKRAPNTVKAGYVNSTFGGGVGDHSRAQAMPAHVRANNKRE